MGHSYCERRSQRWRGLLLAGACALGLGIATSPTTAQGKVDPAKERISLDLKDADLRDAIAMIFKDTDLNYALEEGVAAAGVSLTLNNVERIRALEVLLKTRGFEYTVTNNIYTIKRKAGAAPAGGVPGMEPGMPGEAVPTAGLAEPAGMPVAGMEGGATPSTASTARASWTKVALRHLHPFEALAVLTGSSGGNAGQYGGTGGGYGGYGGYGNNSMGGMGGGMGNMGGFGGSMGGLGGGIGGNTFGGIQTGSGGGGFGGNSFRPSIRR